MIDTETDTTKTAIVHALRAWITQRPGLDYANYGDLTAYRREARSIQRDYRDAKQLLLAVELSDVSGEELRQAFRAYGGRMTCTIDDQQGVTLDYCTGQYWPAEYRRAVAAIAATALWDHYREQYAREAQDGESPGEAIRRKFRSQFGHRIQRRWLD